MTSSSAGSRASDRSALKRGQLVGVEAADGDGLDGRREVVAGVQDGLGEVGRPALDDRVGDEPAQDDVGVVGGGAGRELDAPSGRRGPHGQAELGAGVDHGVGGAIGHTGVQRDLDVGAGAVGGEGGPRAGLQQRVGEERAEPVELGVVERRPRRTPGQRR